MSDSKRLYALRAGDLKPEEVRKLGFSEAFIEELKTKGMVFENPDEAHVAALVMTRGFNGFTHKIEVDDERRIILKTPNGDICDDPCFGVVTDKFRYALISEENVYKLLSLKSDLRKTK